MSGVNAVVLIKAETSLINELAEQLVELPGVAEVFSVAGSYDQSSHAQAQRNSGDANAHRVSCL
jgi:DNA-binding Lrp family transcriptional regulator